MAATWAVFGGHGSCRPGLEVGDDRWGPRVPPVGLSERRGREGGKADLRQKGRQAGPREGKERGFWAEPEREEGKGEWAEPKDKEGILIPFLFI